MESQDKVSIILPVYNGQKYLQSSIESCLSQSHRNLELILVDDKSTDRTPEIMRSFQDPRIKIIRNEINQRLPRSLNIGFRYATGDYLTWTSDDNEFSLDAIEKMLTVFKRNPEAGFVYADYWAYYEDTQKKELIRIPNPLNLAQKNDLGACFMYTRRVYDVIGEYNPDYEIVEDYDYWIRVWKKFKMAHLAEPIYLYRYHSKSLTTTRKPNQDLFDAILKYRNGYVGASKLGWTAAYYFENVNRSDMPEGEKQKLIKSTLDKIRRLSKGFYVQFMVLCAVYTLQKNLKELIKNK